MKEFELVAKTYYGLEEILAKELTELGANNVTIGRRAVTFTGDQALMYRANLYLRTAIRILKPILKFKATDADTVYDKVKAFDWSKYLNVKSTFAIDATEVVRQQRKKGGQVIIPARGCGYQFLGMARRA